MQQMHHIFEVMLSICVVDELLHFGAHCIPMQPASLNTRWRHDGDLAPRLSDVRNAPVHIRVSHCRVITNGIAKFPVFAIEWQLRGPPHAHAQMHSDRQADSRRQRKGNVELSQAALPLGSPITRSKSRTNTQLAETVK